MRLLTIVIILSSVLALAATIGAIVVGSRSFEGIVVDKPYEAGVAWDETRRNRERLGWSVVLQGTRYKTGKNELTVIVRDKNGAPLSNADVSIAVSRPSTRAFDKTYTAAAQPGGHYRVVVDLPRYGNWGISVTVSRKNERAGFDKIIYAEQERS